MFATNVDAAPGDYAASHTSRKTAAQSDAQADEVAHPRQVRKKFRSIRVKERFRFYARPYGRATVSLSQAKVIAAVEMLSLAL